MMWCLRINSGIRMQKKLNNNYKLILMKIMIWMKGAGVQRVGRGREEPPRMHVQSEKQATKPINIFLIID